MTYFFCQNIYCRLVNIFINRGVPIQIFIFARRRSQVVFKSSLRYKAAFLLTNSPRLKAGDSAIINTCPKIQVLQYLLQGSLPQPYIFSLSVLRRSADFTLNFAPPSGRCGGRQGSKGSATAAVVLWA